MKLEYIVKENDLKNTYKEIIKSEFGISTRLYQKLIRHKSILINGEFFDDRIYIKPTSDTTIFIDLSYEEDNSNIVPTPMKLDIIYEDEWLIVVNKPTGIPVHPSQLHYEDSLSNGIRYHFDSINLHKKIRPINRIDLNTSGLVAFAKCEYIHSLLSNQMQNKEFVKKYLTIVQGILDEKSGTINLPIARKDGSIIERCVSKYGQKSITHYKVLKENENNSLVECILETGRTHQIRVHMAAIGHPVLGDTLYGNESNLIEGHALHSYYIAFTHPVECKRIELSCKPDWINIF